MEDELKKYYNDVVKLASDAISDAMTQKKSTKNLLISICLALKIRNSCSAIAHLLDLGFVHDSRVLLRSCADAIIVLHEAISNNDIWEHMQADEYERVKVLSKKQNEYQLALNRTPSPEMLKHFDEISAKYSELKKKQLNIKDLAVKHNCLSEYYFFAATANGYVHNTPNVLSKYLKYNKEGKFVEGFIQQPNIEDQYLLADIAITILFKVTLLFSNIFDSNKIQILNNLRNEYLKYIEPILSKSIKDTQEQ